MTWINTCLWWHVYPLGFCGAPIHGPHGPGAPRLRQLLGWLDHAVELGASGLMLGPVFASGSHGYDTLDPLRIDPRLGTGQDFDDLVAACGERGLRVGLDGVFSHVSAEHPLLLAALASGPDSREAALFDIDWEAAQGPVPRVFEGHGQLARLDHASDATVDLVVDVMTHWLDRGIDAWRLDAAYSVDPGFWCRVMERVRVRHPQAWVVGEMIHGDQTGFVAATGMDSVTQYELWKAIWSSLADRNLFELDWALRRHSEMLDTFVPHTFIGNHDVTRIATTVGEHGAVTALAILLTVGGIPAIYAGDEHAFTGVKEERVGGDDAVRPAFPDHPSQLAPWGESVYRAHQQLIGLRRRHPWLVTATTRAVTLENTRCHYTATGTGPDERLDVTIDLDSPTPVTIGDASGQVLWRQG